MFGLEPAPKYHPPEYAKVSAAILTGVVGGGFVGDRAYRQIYSSDFAKQKEINKQQAVLNKETRELTNDSKALRRTEKQQGNQIPRVVFSRQLHQDARHIRRDETKIATLQKESPHPGIPFEVFGFGPGAVTLVIFAVAFGVRARKENRILKKAARMEDEQKEKR